MKVFNDLDKEQAAMYRWIRDTSDHSVFGAITGKAGWIKMDSLEIDQAFREAFHRYEAKRLGQQAVPRAQLRVGILPAELGRILLEYTEAMLYRASFEEGLGGETYGDVDLKCEVALRNLTDAILDLQR